MHYLFQRTIRNAFGWTRPSEGRLGPTGEGEYVRDNGFGHEDWNFNTALAVEGHVYGYCYHVPAPEKCDDRFDIAFATYTTRVGAVDKGWQLVGFYLDCRYVEKVPVDDGVLREKIRDLKGLGVSLGSSWRTMSDRAFLRQMRNDAAGLRWQVLPENVIGLARPVAIPPSMFTTRNYRIVRPTQIPELVFKKLRSLAEGELGAGDFPDEEGFLEGRSVERKHRARERNPALIEAAKAAYRRKHGALFCQICDFDFEKTYGGVGSGFIEGHHTVPLSHLEGVTKNRIRDIAIVCSNCHRMLHKRRPWLTVENLSAEIAKTRKARRS